MVGGAVRDYLLGLPIKEKDWVVVHATPEIMKKQGFLPVGKDFPVFLHPQTHEEYALARTERKKSRGYTGFDFDTSPAISLEEDLKRRDLTFNAMAMTPEGYRVIDPWGGQEDLKKKILRHVSDAFLEDPVRILRVARFMARFKTQGFRVARETRSLMAEMVKNGEVDALVPDRVWKETQKALSEASPAAFFETLAQCKALEKLFPFFADKLLKITSLFFQKNNPEHNFVQIGLLLTETQKKDLFKYYSVSTDYKESLSLAGFIKDYLNLNQAKEKKTEKHAWLYLLFEKCDAFRRPERFIKALGFLNPPSDFCFKIQKCLKKLHALSAEPFIKAGYTGKALGQRLREERLNRMRSLFKKIRIKNHG